MVQWGHSAELFAVRDPLVLPHSCGHPTGSRDKTVRVWDPQTAACVAVLSGHEYQVGMVAAVRLLQVRYACSAATVAGSHRARSYMQPVMVFVIPLPPPRCRDRRAGAPAPAAAAAAAALAAAVALMQVTALGLLPKADGQAGGLVSASLDKCVQRGWRGGRDVWSDWTGLGSGAMLPGGMAAIGSRRRHSGGAQLSLHGLGCGRG